MRNIDDMRKILRCARFNHHCVMAKAALGLWRAVARHRRLHVQGEVIFGFGYIAADITLKNLDIECASNAQYLSKLIKDKNHALKIDRIADLTKTAERAQHAASTNDITTTFKIVRQLAGGKPQQLQGVKDINGELITSKEAASKRWVDHFAKLFVADVAPSLEAAHHAPTTIVNEHSFTPDLKQLQGAVMRLNVNKAAGPDGICARVLRSGGHLIIWHLYMILQAITNAGYMPMQWRGGRLAVRSKDKGDDLVCDNNRGLLISDHAGKAIVTLLYEQMQPQYMSFVSQNQHGSTAGRGTNMAIHSVSTFMELCTALGLCSASLFVDLSKAFDTAIRELIMGPLDNGEYSMEDILRQLGLSTENASKLIQWMRSNPPVLESMGIDPMVIQLIKSMHSGAWFLMGLTRTLSQRPEAGRDASLAQLSSTLSTLWLYPDYKRSWTSSALRLCCQTLESSSSFQATPKSELPQSRRVMPQKRSCLKSHTSTMRQSYWLQSRHHICASAYHSLW